MCQVVDPTAAVWTTKLQPGGQPESAGVTRTTVPWAISRAAVASRDFWVQVWPPLVVSHSEVAP